MYKIAENLVVSVVIATSILILALVALAPPRSIYAQSASPPATAVPLPVPLIGQGYCQPKCGTTAISWNGRNNCGPASLAMVADANGIPRPVGAVTNSGYVRHIKTLTEGTDNCDGTTRGELDSGAEALGLCIRDADESELDTVEEIRDAIVGHCLPVVTILDSDSMPWKHNAAFYRDGGLDHIVVTTAVWEDQVAINDPLENTGDLTCDTQDNANSVYGTLHSRYDLDEYPFTG